MTDVFTLIEKQIYTRLTTTAGTALYGARIHKEQAPAKETMPYVVFYLASCTFDNDHPRRAFHAVYTAECVAETMAQARQGAGYIDEALNGYALPLEDGWTNYFSLAKGMRSLTENVEKGQLYRAGFDFDIRGAK